MQTPGSWLVLPMLLLGAVAVQAADKEVVLKGALVCDGMNSPTAQHVRVLLAVDGSPAIAAVVKKIMDDFYPDKGLDAPAALKLQTQFDTRLKFYLAPDSPAAPPPGMENPGPKHYCHTATWPSPTRSPAPSPNGTAGNGSGRPASRPSARTCTIRRRCCGPMRPSSCRTTSRWCAEHQRRPVLSISAGLTLTCIKIPAGSCMMGEHIFVATRYLEQTPRLCQLTKPYYLSESPITQEIWEAVMGDNTSKDKNAKLPVEDAPFPQIEKFCAALAEKTGHAIRLPTGAEWEYAARVGTSNPGLVERYKDQALLRDDAKIPLPVKAKKANAWGIYDLFSPWWELTSDAERYPGWKAEVDPSYPAVAGGKHMLLGVIGGGWTISEREFESNSGYAPKKFRIAFDGDPPAK